jgi:UDP-N-acetylmuramoylalanine--D-glutamate ligase
MNLVRFQKRTDLAVLNADNTVSRSFQNITKGQVVFFSRRQETNGAYVKNHRLFYQEELIGGVSRLLLKGEHNWENVAAAVTVAKKVRIETKVIRKTIFSFRPLEHRLEFVRELKGVTFYNDSFSTTPETAIAAMRAFKEPIILIAGGSEKGSDYTDLGKEIARNQVRVLILLGLMADKIRSAAVAAGFNGEIVFRPASMVEAVSAAKKRVQKGEVVLLSPACASFDMFEDYKDRGQQFKKYVQAL